MSHTVKHGVTGSDIEQISGAWSALMKYPGQVADMYGNDWVELRRLLTVRGNQQYWWRAVDRDGEGVDVFLHLVDVSCLFYSF